MFRHTPPILLHILYLLAVGFVILWWYAEALVRFALKVFPAPDPASNFLAGTLAFLLSTAAAASCIAIFTWPMRRRKTRTARARR